MSKLFMLVSLVISVQAFSNDDQSTVEDFFKNHEASSFKVYCRKDVDVPECRTLIKYIDKSNGQPVDAFQIAFSAHARPLAATELFIPEPTCGSNGNGAYRSYVDITHSGTFVVAKTSEHNVKKQGGTITITDLPFGSLSFSDHVSIVKLGNGNEIKYKRMR